MSVKAVFFDLDGTLLPMNQEEFTKGYFRELAKVLAPLGIAPQALVAAIWDGTGAMVRNTGKICNADVFWTRFAQISGLDTAMCRPLCDEFYQNQFHAARAFTGENPRAAEAVRLAKENGRTAVLATNPIFPLVGQASRLSWIGLGLEDFTLVTSYESESVCKPNPAYYTAICQRLDIPPEQCLMIGNDDEEDMYAAAAAGIPGYLVTDCRIPSADRPWQGPQGTFREMLEMLKTLE